VKQTLAEKKEAAKQVVETMHAALAAGIEGDADWAQYLRFISNLRGYSARNSLLLYVQWEARRRYMATMRGMQAAMFGAPTFEPLAEMRHVAGFSTWADMGGQVRKGEKALSVLAPFIIKDREELDENGKPKEKLLGFVVKNRTFEMSQFAGIEAPPEPVKLLEGESPEGLWDHLVSLAEGIGFSVRLGDTGDANGYCSHATNEIVVSPKNEGLQRVKTLIHEVAHALLHGDDRPRGMPTSVLEVEAESVAYAVAEMVGGFDSASYSFGYVGTWSRGDGALIASTLERVSTCAAQIATFIETGALPARKAASSFDFTDFFTGEAEAA